MWVWVWVWVCVCVSLSLWVLVRECARAHIWERESVCECVWVCVCERDRVCVCECVRDCKCEWLSVCVWVRVCECMRVTVCMWECVSVCVCVCKCECVILFVALRSLTLNIHIALNVRIIYEHWIGNFETNCSNRQWGISPALSCKGKEKHFSFRIRRISRDTNQTSPEYKSQLLPLHQSASCRILVYVANYVTRPI